MRREGRGPRVTISKFGQIAMANAVILWLRQYRDHGFFPAAIVTGKWTRPNLPGGYEEWLGVLKFEDSPLLPSLSTDPDQNTTIRSIQAFATPITTSKKRRGSQGPDMVDTVIDSRRLTVRADVNLTQEVNTTQNFSSSNNIPADPYEIREANCFPVQFLRFRERYVPIIDMLDLSFDCFVSLFFQVEFPNF